MSLVALVSAKGSPGTTTTALALAFTWPRRVLLAECDPAGGDLAAGFFGATSASASGLLDLAVDARRSELATELPHHAVSIDDAGHRMVLSGVQNQSQASSLAPWWDRLGTLFTGLADEDPPTDVLVDCGRLSAQHPPTPLLHRADTVVLVLRPTLRSVAHARQAIAALRQELGRGRDLRAVIVGERQPYAAREVAEALDVAVSAIGFDARAAAVLSDGAVAGRRFVASSLMRGARSLAESLNGHPSDVHPSTEAAGAEPVTSQGHPERAT